jgi:hypothetical protein
MTQVIRALPDAILGVLLGAWSIQGRVGSFRGRGTVANTGFIPAPSVFRDIGLFLGPMIRSWRFQGDSRGTVEPWLHNS